MRRAGALLLVLCAATPAASAEGVHVVQPGETLWQIALNRSGDPSRWPELYRANRDQIKDPSMLYPGQRLTIPDFDGEPGRGDGAGARAAAPEAPPETPE